MDSEAGTSRKIIDKEAGKKAASVVLWVSIVRSDSIIETVKQANVAGVERLIEEISEFGYQGKHRARLRYSQDELIGSDVVEKEVRTWRQRGRGQRRQGLHREELARDTEAVELRIESVNKGYLPALPRIECLLYLCTNKPRPADQELASVAYSYLTATATVNCNILAYTHQQSLFRCM